MKASKLAGRIALGIVVANVILHVVHAETYHLKQPGNEVSKFEALRLTMKDPSTIIYKCNAVAMTNKATFKNVPNGGGTQFISEPQKR